MGRPVSGPERAGLAVDNQDQDDEYYMAMALEEARKGAGTTDPNPMVGAIIVEKGVVVARGYHARCGEPHAEKVAFAGLGRLPGPGAKMYVTLEPCSTLGRTGACTDAILASGIREIIVGAIDPNPSHRGRGLDILRKAGIKVRNGVLTEECETLNSEFNRRMGQG